MDTYFSPIEIRVSIPSLLKELPGSIEQNYEDMAVSKMADEHFGLFGVCFVQAGGKFNVCKKQWEITQMRQAVIEMHSKNTFTIAFSSQVKKVYSFIGGEQQKDCHKIGTAINIKPKEQVKINCDRSIEGSMFDDVIKSILLYFSLKAHRFQIVLWANNYSEQKHLSKIWWSQLQLWKHTLLLFSFQR